MNSLIYLESFIDLISDNNVKGLLLAHFVVLVFHKKICLKEGKDWQKVISNIGRFYARDVKVV